MLPLRSVSSLPLAVKCVPHSGQTTSLWRPISVGAIEPVGITKASASKALNRNARAKAMAIDSIVSRSPRDHCELLGASDASVNWESRSAADADFICG